MNAPNNPDDRDLADEWLGKRPTQRAASELTTALANSLRLRRALLEQSMVEGLLETVSRQPADRRQRLQRLLANPWSPAGMAVQATKIWRSPWFWAASALVLFGVWIFRHSEENSSSLDKPTIANPRTELQQESIHARTVLPSAHLSAPDESYHAQLRTILLPEFTCKSRPLPDAMDRLLKEAAFPKIIPPPEILYDPSLKLEALPPVSFSVRWSTFSALSQVLPLLADAEAVPSGRQIVIRPYSGTGNKATKANFATLLLHQFLEQQNVPVTLESACPAFDQWFASNGFAGGTSQAEGEFAVLSGNPKFLLAAQALIEDALEERTNWVTLDIVQLDGVDGSIPDQPERLPPFVITLPHLHSNGDRELKLTSQKSISFSRSLPVNTWSLLSDGIRVLIAPKNSSYELWVLFGDSVGGGPPQVAATDQPPFGFFLADSQGDSKRACFLSLTKPLPHTYPMGILVPSSIGVVRSPFASATAPPVEVGSAKPGELLRCPETGNYFIIPYILPGPRDSAMEDLPYATPAVGKAGFVHSPYAPDKGLVDVTDIPRGTKVECPFTRKLFRVP